MKLVQACLSAVKICDERFYHCGGRKCTMKQKECGSVLWDRKEVTLWDRKIRVQYEKKLFTGSSSLI